MSAVNLKIGERVEVTDKKLPGTIRYVGQTQFSAGKWIGVELDEPKGKNDGTVQGKQYFQCAENYGMFVRAQQVFACGSGDSGSADSWKLSGLKPPSQRGTKQGSDDKMKTSTNSNPGLMKPSKSSERLRASQEKLKGSPSMERLKQKSPSNEKLSSKSASSEKLKADSPDKLKSPASSSESLASKGSTASSAKAPPSSDRKPSKGGLPVATPAAKEATPPKIEAPKEPPAVKTDDLFAEGHENGEVVEKMGEPVTQRRTSVAQRAARIQQDVARSRDEAIQRIGPVGLTPVANMDSSAELEYLRMEVKDLREKLETLRSKRSEDKVKLIEYEKCQIQLQQLIEYKTKMSEQHAALQRQLQQAQKEAREAIEARESHAEEMSGLAEAIELATLDKEMAEEKCEMLQQEVDSLKEKIEELTLDIEILRQEFQNKGDDLAHAGSEDSLSVKQLEMQNERLKEAIVRLRDFSEHEKRENQRLIKELESLRTDHTDVSRKFDKISTENAQYEQNMQDLKEQVDASLGAEEMVEQLTQRNLALEERIQQMEENIVDLEQMREMDEELQENAREAEREIQEELDMTRGKVTELRFKLQQAHDQMQDLEATIVKFRKHTVSLQEEIQDLKDKLDIAQHQNKEIEQVDAENNVDADLPKTTPTITSIGPLTDAQKFENTVKHEIEKIELNNFDVYVRYLKLFLPDNFHKPGGDGDSVLLNLLFPRFVAKAELLVIKLKLRYPVPPNGMNRDHVTKSHKSDQWSFCYKFIYQLHGLICLMHKYQTALNKCSVERLSRVAQLRRDMDAQERALGYYLDLLQNNRLDENTTMEQLEKMYNFFQNIYSVHLATDAFDHSKFMLDCAIQCICCVLWIITDLRRIKFYLLPGSDGSDLWKCLESVELFVTEADSCARKVKSAVSNLDATKVTVNIPEEVLNRVGEVTTQLDRVGKLLHRACESASNQVTLIPDVDGLEVNRMQELLNDATDYIGARGQDGKTKSFEDELKNSMNTAVGHLQKLSETIEKGEYDVPVADKKEFPPLLERADLRRQEAVEADGLRWQLDKKDNDMMELKKALRLKAEEVSEMQVRKEMAEKRLQATGKEGDERILKLQRKLEEHNADIKKRDREYENTMDTLQQDIDLLEKENVDLKERIKLLSKKVLLEGMHKASLGSPSAPSATAPLPSPGVLMQDSPVLLQQLNSLRSALSMVQLEKHWLQTQRMQNALTDLSPLKVPKKPTGLQSATGLVDLDHLAIKRHGDVGALLRETNKLQNDMVDFLSGHRVIDISKRKPAEVPVLTKATPKYQLQQQIVAMRRLKEWSDDLHFRLQKQKKMELAPSTGGSADKPVLSCPIGESMCIGRVTVATDDAALAGSVVPMTVSMTQLRQLHAQFAC